MNALAIVSVLSVFAGAALAAAGASWRVGAYVSIVGVLFDVVFSYEFFIHLLQKERPFPWLRGASSVLPLLLVSGPFISGWASLDLGASAVRGFWLGASPIGGLAVVAALRLLRVARPFQRAKPATGSPGGRVAVSGAAAAAVGIVAVLLGAAASDALLVPGLASVAAARRESAVSAIAAATSDGERVSAALAAKAVALSVDGRVLVAAPSGISPTAYAVESRDGVSAWFEVADEARARGAAAAIAALASLLAAAGYAIAFFDPFGSSNRATDGSDHSLGDAARRNRPADKPAGSEELEGILGKRRF
ncbi:MAG: hypothetical protein CVV47_04730 [Spirochaetae bacterium HGW-Spirochaetae-3]|nr:MAG: hypothetical protein CVV47_04730 [Spirochaetae bacterium HGW-Spirochaetae-3]